VAWSAGWTAGFSSSPPSGSARQAPQLRQTHARAGPRPHQGADQSPVEPGRTAPRLYQFARGVPIEVVARAVADWVQGDEHENARENARRKRKKDWFLVRAWRTRPPGEVSARTSESNTTTQPAIRPSPSPAGCGPLSSNWICPTRSAKVWPPPMCARLACVRAEPRGQSLRR